MDENVILQFHPFIHHGKNYVIDIENMRASSIDEITTEALEMMVMEPDTLSTFGLEEDLIQHKLTSPIPITTMALFLTQSCNLKCSYCYGDGGEYGGGGSTEEKTALQAVDWLIEHSERKKKLNIVFFGGEPFINFPLMKAVVHYTQQRVNEVEKNVAFHVTTNATLLNDEAISFLKEHKVNVMVSIDGPKEIQDRQRPFASGKGSFDTIVPKIEKLLEALPETRGHAVIADTTDPLIVKKALKEIGFTKITTAIMSASLFDEESGRIKPARDLRQILHMMELEAEAWLNYTKNKNTESLRELITNGYLAEGIVSMLHNNKKQYPCKAGLEFVAVSCAGDVYPCQRFVGLDKYKLGSVFTEDLDRDIYHKLPRTQVKECASCFAKYYCAGGCKYMNAVSGGSIFTQSKDLCQLKRRELELSAYISSLLDHKDYAFLIENDIFPPKPCPLDF